MVLLEICFEVMLDTCIINDDILGIGYHIMYDKICFVKAMWCKLFGNSALASRPLLIKTIGLSVMRKTIRVTISRLFLSRPVFLHQVLDNPLTNNSVSVPLLNNITNLLTGGQKYTLCDCNVILWDVMLSNLQYRYSAILLWMYKQGVYRK